MKSGVRMSLVAATLALGADRAMGEARSVLAELGGISVPAGEPLSRLGERHKEAVRRHRMEPARFMGMPTIEEADAMGISVADYAQAMASKIRERRQSLRAEAERNRAKWNADLPGFVRPMSKMSNRF